MARATAQSTRFLGDLDLGLIDRVLDVLEQFQALIEAHRLDRGLK